MNTRWVNLRRELLKAYDSIHALTLTKWFYEDHPDEYIWKDKRLWIHISCTLFSQLTIMAFKIYYLTLDLPFVEALVSLTGGLVIILVAVRTFVLYTRLSSFRRLYFKPEVFNSNKHRPTSSLSQLIKVMKHSRTVGLWCLGLFVVFDVSLLVLPLGPPLAEMVRGTNKTYDELIPMYPSINPVSLWWLNKEVKYAYDLTVAVANTMPWVGLVAMYYAIVNLVRTQHRIMISSLKRGSDVEDDDPEPMDLKLWIEDHVLIRSLVFELRATMSPTLAGTVAVNVFTVGLNMLVLLSQPPDPRTPTFFKIIFYFSFLAYSAVSLCDLFIHCWLSAEITDIGGELRGAIYDTEWYTKLKMPHQDYVLPLMICDKPIQLTALGLIPVQIKTFTEAIRLSYSYYTLLKKTGNNGV